MSHTPQTGTVGFEVVDGVGLVTLNRPEVLNAVDDAMRGDLRTVLDHVAATPEVRALVVTGAGKAFCAGGDVRAMQERLSQGSRAAEIGWHRQRELHETLGRLRGLDRPTLAAVNGPAYGLGLDLALTCDFVWASETARLASSFIKRGLIPDGGGMYHLPRRVGLARAKELVFSGRPVAAPEALEMGLVDRVEPGDRLVPDALAWLGELAADAATARALAKGILDRSLDLTYEELNTAARQAQALCYSTEDHTRLVREFLDERERARAAR